MDIFDRLFNQEEKNKFTGNVKTGRLSHAYIIEGAEGSGKKTFALFAAAAIQCTGSDIPCGSCSGCIKIKNSNHPDVSFYEPPGDKQFSIDTVRDIKSSLFLTPGESEKKIYILSKAEKMTAAAQNAILKFFEDPPDSAVFFLLTSQKQSLLPTVVSRGLPISLYPAEKEAVVKYLKSEVRHMTDTDAEKYAEMSGGLPGRALELAGRESSGFGSEIENLCLLLSRPYSFDFYAALVSPKRSRQESKELLSGLSCGLVDIIKAKQGISGTALLSPSCAKELALHMTVKKLMLMNDSILKAYEDLDINTNITSTLAVLSDRLAHIKR